MRKLTIISLLIIVLSAACTAQAAPTEEAGEPTEAPAETAPPTESATEPVPGGPVEETVIKQLAENLGIPESDITVASSEEAEFRDACLDVAMEGILCAQVMTPGRIVVLEANGIQYRYHTSQDGGRVQPATIAMVWKREGGIAGFCDIMTVFLSGEVFATTCKSQAEGTMAVLGDVVTPAMQKQFNDWMARFGEAHLDASDPKGVADRMVVTLDIFGMGSRPPSQDEQQALFKFAQDLHKRAGAPLK